MPGVVDIIINFLNVADALERKNKRADYRILLWIIISIALLVIIFANKQWFGGVHTTLLVVAVFCSALILALLTIFGLNKAGFVCNISLPEFVSIAIMLALFYGVGLLAINNGVGLII